MLQTPEGYKAVEDLVPGDVVYARNEYNPDGPVAGRVVEAKFERTGCVLHLHFAGGKLIRTTPEHPFYVEGKGWTAAGALAGGERLRTAWGWAELDEAFDTNCYERVYNLRVAEDHTYFVGEEEWGFAVWAHNASCGDEQTVSFADLSSERKEKVMRAFAYADQAVQLKALLPNRL
jgi:hypothetical protein